MAKTVKTEEPLLNWFQACNALKVTGMNRRVVEKKFEDTQLSEKEWQSLLKKEKLA